MYSSSAAVSNTVDYIFLMKEATKD